MLKHAIFEGARNLVRSFWLSVTAIFIITVSLTSVALVATLIVVTGFALRQFDSQALIYVYLNQGTSAESRELMI
jgi:cell division protein FtsX